ncbi:hypothetical protein WOLCODRAFT_159505 [Wolfiporia cocos MD-104 SS10]|uniref:Uncharacterized protein n=1 Tax=Wolfiporia cocos (strain MD-104) TaxID=742152 RepID=A0A2H3JAC2_WOLCO|nr:hypothetical protein WOLCODRAFT_159505 [Wolfiporia cocos MD-104 SS10]
MGKALRRQGNPPRTKSNSGAAALPNAPPPPPTTPTPASQAKGAQSGNKPATGSRARPKGTHYPGGVPLTKPPAGTGNRHPLRHPKAPSRTVAGTEHQARRQGLPAQVSRHQPPPPDAVTASQAKAAARESPSSEGQKGKANTHQGRSNAHAGVGHPSTQHRAGSGTLRTPLRHRPSRTSNSPARRKTRAHLRYATLEKGRRNPIRLSAHPTRPRPPR